MRKKLFVVFLLLFLAALLVACNNIDNDAETVEVIDFVGDVVKVPKNPKKVAVVARSAVDMLFAFGLEDNIDGMYKTIFDNPWASYLYPNIDEYYKYEYNETYEV